MSEYLFPPPPVVTLPILGETTLYPVRRIFCVGRNYAEHALELGNEVDRSAPFYFKKSPSNLWQGGSIPFPLATSDLHHEVELVLAIGAPIPNHAGPEQAKAAIYARAVGLDLTRRDLQSLAKDKKRPWDVAKDFENAAVIGQLSSAKAGPEISLQVNGITRQQDLLSSMIFDEGEILSDLSRFYDLGPGDLVMTGTPAGVSPLQIGDRLCGRIEGLPELNVEIIARN